MKALNTNREEIVLCAPFEDQSVQNSSLVPQPFIPLMPHQWQLGERTLVPTSSSSLLSVGTLGVMPWLHVMEFKRELWYLSQREVRINKIDTTRSVGS